MHFYEKYFRFKANCWLERKFAGGGERKGVGKGMQKYTN